MQGSWYKYFLFSLRSYYKSKGFFIFFFKLIIILKLISIILDIYFGYFPNIFKDIILKFYFLNLYNVFYSNFLYWVANFWFFCLFIFCCFWFFFRIGSLDSIELMRRKKLKEQQLKKKNEKVVQSNKITIKKQKDVLKKKVKGYRCLINKYL